MSYCNTCKIEHTGSCYTEGRDQKIKQLTEQRDELLKVCKSLVGFLFFFDENKEKLDPKEIHTRTLSLMIKLKKAIAKAENADIQERH